MKVYKRIAFVILLAAVLTVGFIAPAPQAAQAADCFQACPFPPCMAPCQLGGEPQGVCRTPNGHTFKTTFACCCCGGGGGTNEFCAF